MPDPFDLPGPAEIRRRVAAVLTAESVTLQDNWPDPNEKSQQSVVVAEPASQAELTQVLTLAQAEGWKISPAGADTQTGYGNVLLPVQLVVSSARLNRMLDYSPADLVVTVQSGMRLRDLQRELAKEGQMLPLDPVCHPDASVGGVFATGVSGPLRTLYGTLRDMTIGLRTVFASGEVVTTGGKVVKNVAGYDMTKLLVGSLGTLAYVSELTFKLRPLPRHTEVCLLSGTAAQIQTAVAAVIDSTLTPSRMEVLHGPYPRCLHLPAAVSSDPWVLVVESHDNARAAAHQSKSLAQLAEQCALAIEVREGEATSGFWSDYQTALQGAQLQIRYSVPPNRTVTFSERLANLLSTLAQSICFSATPVAGVVRVFANNLSLDEEREVLSCIRNSVQEHKGSAVVENGSPALRRSLDAFAAGTLEIALQRRVKDAFDPNHMLNPGRFLGGM